MNDVELYDKALATYGIKQQLVVCMEECSELAKECAKIYRAFESEEVFGLSNIAEEIADVQIITGQIERFFLLKDAVKRNRKSKLKRLAERVKQNEKHEG